MPKTSEWKSNEDVEDVTEVQQTNKIQQFLLHELEIVHETADILCLLCAIDFKRVTNILVDVLEQMFKHFIKDPSFEETTDKVDDSESSLSSA